MTVAGHLSFRLSKYFNAREFLVDFSSSGALDENIVKSRIKHHVILCLHVVCSHKLELQFDLFGWNTGSQKNS